MIPSVRQDGFDWLDKHLIESLQTPDEAFDWVFMMSDGEWIMLESVWDERQAEWREALAYLVCDGPIRQSQSILRRALFDPNLRVAAEAACSLCNHRGIEPDLVDFNPTIVARLKVVFDQNGGKNMETVAAVLAQM